MSLQGTTPLAPWRDRPDWVSRLLGAMLITLTGVLLGLQYIAPDKRVLAVLAAIVILGISWRLNLVSGLGLLALTLPFPRGVVFGNTNFAFILLLLIIWLLRASQRQAAWPRSTPVDVPVMGLVLAYIVSFYNIEKVSYLGYAVGNFLILVASVGLFYLVVNILRKREDLARFHEFQAVTIACVCLLGIFELYHPSGTLIPGWIVFHGPAEGQLEIHNYRIGGPFSDFELFSEWCAINVLLVLFLYLRARTAVRKVLYAALLATVAFVMFATLTRGAMIALATGVLYLAWVLRRRLRMVPVTLVVIGLIAAFEIMNFYVANFTHSGNLLARLLDPQTMKFQGILPVSRADIWLQAFQRMMEHPLIGHGPYYSTERGLGFWYWPHNGYLYMGNIVGLVGLGFFLWLLGGLWRLTKSASDDLHDADYARAFLAIAHVQLVVFMLDQIKIDFARNPIYMYQVWLMFASIVAAHQIVAHEAPPRLAAA